MTFKIFSGLIEIELNCLWNVWNWVTLFIEYDLICVLKEMHDIFDICWILWVFVKSIDDMLGYGMYWLIDLLNCSFTLFCSWNIMLCVSCWLKLIYICMIDDENDYNCVLKKYFVTLKWILWNGISWYKLKCWNSHFKMHKVFVHFI